MRALILTAAIVCLSTAARAETYYFPGSQCTSQAANIYVHPYFGSYNISTTTNYDVWCGTRGIEKTTNGISSASVTVYDRHSTEAVSCTLYVTNQTGGAIYTNTQSTTSWSYSAMTLSWTVSSTGGDYATIKCTIPKQDSAGASHVASYKFVD